MSRIALLTGGSTPERDVAFAGAAQVVRALRERGHEVTVVDTVNGPLAASDESRALEPAVGRAPPTLEELRTLARREDLAALVTHPDIVGADLVFLVLHGRQGEGGEVQQLLDDAGICYTGSGPSASALAMDKDAAKRQFRASGVPTPDWVMWPADPHSIGLLGLPLVVKPSNVGSSVGLTVVRSDDGLAPAVELAAEYDDAVMLERYVGGREYTVGVLGDRALAVGEIIPQHEVFDYECKYTPGMTREVFPADLAPESADRLRDVALTAHRRLGLRDFSRVDFKLDPDSGPQCLEVNSLPGLTRTSLLPQSAEAAGVTFADLCEAICRTALSRKQERNKRE